MQTTATRTRNFFLARFWPRWRVMSLLRLWHRRHVTRRHLEMLDARGLADIGIDPRHAQREAEKPFWRG